MLIATASATTEIQVWLINVLCKSTKSPAWVGVTGITGNDKVALWLWAVFKPLNTPARLYNLIFCTDVICTAGLESL